MNGMDEIQPQEVSEATEVVEEQALAEATYDADAHVEQSGNYEQSEAVETTFTEVVDSIVEAPEQTPVEEPKMTQEVDPVTGQSKPSGGGSEETGPEEEPLVVDEDQSEMEAPAGTAVEEVDQTGSDTNTDAEAASDAANAQREGEEYGSTAVLTGDEKPGAQATAVDKSVGLVGDEGVDAGQIEEPQIERHLPEEAILAAGMGKYGLITGDAQGKQKHGMGDRPGMGKGTSGGGSPVGNYGAGSVGDDDISYDPNWEEGDDEDDGIDALIEWGTDEEIEEYERGMQERALDIAVMQEQIEVALTLDGGTPMPYTGSTYGGAPTDLSHRPPAGPDECGFLQMIAGGKMDAKSYYGYGSTGSATFSPSGGGDEDDSGNFYGGLTGSDDGRPGVFGPDDLDYYTPNELAEALAKAQEK